MADQKTKPTEVSVDSFIDSVPDEQRRNDSRVVLEMMRRITGEEPTMWGPTMVGFGSYHYKYESGREGDSFITGFSPRKNALTLYIMPGFERYDDLMSRLGTYKTGKSCLYLKKLSDVDPYVLEELVEQSYEYMKEKYPEG